MADMFSDFLDRPSALTYLPLRRAIMRAADHDPQTTALTEFTSLVRSGDRDAVRAAIPGLMATHLLSPGAHFLMAASARAAGDEAAAGREVAMAQACLHGIGDTGDGSLAAPYRCVHVSDEYDMAAARGRSVQSTRSEVRDGRYHDVLACDDGSEMWFDVTDSIALAAQV